jgi:hypothetical protein
MRNYTLLLLLPLLAGCTPESAVWSPDGTKLAIATNQGVYLTDVDRNAGGPIAQRPWSLTPVAWFPSGEELLVVERRAGTWKEIEAILGPDKGREAKALASRIEKGMQELSQGPSFDLPGSPPREVAIGAWAWIAESQPAGIVQALRQIPVNTSDAWQQVLAWHPEIHSISRFRVNGLSAEKTSTLHETLGVIWSVRLSPDGKRLAVVKESSREVRFESFQDSTSSAGGGPVVLDVLDLASGSWQTIAEHPCLWPAWSPTGDALYFFQVAMSWSDRRAPSDSLIGSLRVWSANGTDPPETILESMVEPFTKLTVLNDGRIVFAADPATFPSPPVDRPRSMLIYLVDPKSPRQWTTVLPSRVPPEVTDALFAGSYAVSPDGAELALTTKKGETLRMVLATGTLEGVETGVSDGKEAWGIATPAPLAPAWNRQGEFVFLVPGKKGQTPGDRPALFLKGPNRLQQLSENWPWFESMKPSASN